MFWAAVFNARLNTFEHKEWCGIIHLMEHAFESHKVPGARVAVVTFGSFNNGGRPSPPYAFMNCCLRLQKRSAVAFDVYYFLANQNDWYFSGIKGLGSIEESASRVRDIIRHHYSL